MRLAVSSTFGAIALLLHLYVQITWAQNTNKRAADATTAGPFHILYCDAPYSGGTQASYLRAFLPAFQSTVQNLLQDLAQGTASQHGYSAFFKSNAALNTTTQIYQDMANGKEVLGGPWDSQSQSFTEPPEWSPPLIVCANPGEDATEDGQEMCDAPGSTTNVAVVPKNQGTVYLCPNFFRLPRVARRAACPVVDPVSNQFVGDGFNLAFSQYGVLVHEMYHLYNTENTLTSEIYDIQGAVDLTEEASVMNAQNYALYAAGGFEAQYSLQVVVIANVRVQLSKPGVRTFQSRRNYVGQTHEITIDGDTDKCADCRNQC